MEMARQVKSKVIEDDQVGVVTYTGSKIHKKAKESDGKQTCC